jgi:hypothetical protein
MATHPASKAIPRTKNTRGTSAAENSIKPASLTERQSPFQRK